MMIMIMPRLSNNISYRKDESLDYERRCRVDKVISILGAIII